MYRKPRFLEVLHEIREEMSREADYDVDLFTEMVRSNRVPAHGPERNIRGFRSRAPRKPAIEVKKSTSSEAQSTTSHRRKRRVAR